MTKQRHIKFEFKCDQKQSSFTRIDGNPFCHACQTTVFNLTDKSIDDIHILIDQGDGQICGQFFIDQIGERQHATSPINLNIILASLATFLTISSPKMSAQTKGTNKTEQHDTTLAVTKNKKPIDNTDTICKDISDEEHSSWTTLPNGVKRKQYMVIGRRHFYVINKFPFFRSRKMRMGRIMRRGTF